uniref:Uncharacterized protein n=1 Tax=Cyanoderma ruficeps TaxID=181631 RepID=A0A8C3QZM1_9PASS
VGSSAPGRGILCQNPACLSLREPPLHSLQSSPPAQGIRDRTQRRTAAVAVKGVFPDLGAAPNHCFDKWISPSSNHHSTPRPNSEHGEASLL